MRIRATGLACFLLLLPVGAPAGEACPRVAALGNACRAPGGWRIVLRDGTSLFTHGPDAVPSLRLAQAVAATTPLPPSCAPDRTGDFHGVVIYARATDTPSNYAARAPDIRDWIAIANGVLRDEAEEFGRELDYRISCEAGRVAVFDVELSTALAETTYGSIVSDLRLGGFASPLEKYWVWLDGHPPNAPGGLGSIWDDDRAAAGNRNNVGPSYGVTFGYGMPYAPGIMMHEDGHNLGAVQDSAVASSGAFHCNDGLDVMCYADGGPTSSYSASVCAVKHFDCNHDSYFHPAPADDHPLAATWNLGSPLNRFVAGCLYASGVLAVGLGGVAIEDVSARTHAVAESCGGRPFALSGISLSALPGGDAFRAQTQYADLDVCWLGGATELRCDTVLGTERGIVPPGATSARVVLKVGAEATYVLSAV